MACAVLAVVWLAAMSVAPIWLPAMVLGRVQEFGCDLHNGRKVNRAKQLRNTPTLGTENRYSDQTRKSTAGLRGER